MNFYEKYILPKVVHMVCSVGPAMKQRMKIVPQANGNVLEIGIGSGLNLEFYNADKVTKLWGLDPSDEMWSIAQKKSSEHPVPLEFIKAGAEAIPLESNVVDTVVFTYTMCSIPDVDTALSEIRRVMKPGAQLLFCEHGKAPDEAVLKWQNRINPIWKKFGGGCNLNKDIPGLIESGGFKIDTIDTMYLPGWKPATFNYWGMAKVK